MQVHPVLSVTRVQGEHAHTRQYVLPYNNLIVNVEEGLLELLDFIPSSLDGLILSLPAPKQKVRTHGHALPTGRPHLFLKYLPSEWHVGACQEYLLPGHTYTLLCDSHHNISISPLMHRQHSSSPTCQVQLCVFLLCLTPCQIRYISMLTLQTYKPCSHAMHWHRTSFQLDLRPMLYSMFTLPTFYADLLMTVPAAILSIMLLVALSLSH